LKKRTLVTSVLLLLAAVFVLSESVFSQSRTRSSSKRSGYYDSNSYLSSPSYYNYYSAPKYNSYSYPEYKSYSVPEYRTYDYSYPTQRNYQSGGQLRLQNGYLRSNGTYVQPHFKTGPDQYKWNNRKNLYGW
jgi:hypothetical protein